MFIDSHCHLGFHALGEHTDKTIKILENAKNNNISHVLDIATDVNLFQSYLDFSKMFNKTNTGIKIYNAIGVHPLHIENNSQFTEESLKAHCKHDNLIAIGETGFDGHYSTEHFVKQREYFNVHAQVSLETKLPIIIHSRSANKYTLEALSYYKSKSLTGVIHCFSGDITFAKQILDLNFHISFSGVLTFKNAKELHEVAQYVPVERILVETDSPYLTPVPHRGKINEPAYVKYVAEKLASLRNLPIDELNHQLQNNFFNLFTKAIK